MDIEEIKAKVRANEYVYTYHADIERKADELTFITVYIPRPPKFVDPWTRGDRRNERSSV